MMKLKILILSGILFACLSPLHAQSQPSPTVASGPPLAVTTQFIIDKLNAQGPISWMDQFYHGYPAKEHRQILSATFDSTGCTISTTEEESDDDVEDFATTTLHLHDVETVQVVSLQDEYDARTAGTVFSHRTAFVPNLYRVTLTAPQPIFTRVQGKSIKNGKPQKTTTTTTQTVGYYFLDAQLANRVGKAATHAVELCGGGKKNFQKRASEPF